MSEQAELNEAKIKILELEKEVLEMKLELQEWQNISRQTTNVERVYYGRLDCMPAQREAA